MTTPPANVRYLIRIERQVNLYVGNGWRSFYPGHLFKLANNGIDLHNINGADYPIPYRAHVSDEDARAKLEMWATEGIVSVIQASPCVGLPRERG